MTIKILRYDGLILSPCMQLLLITIAFCGLVCARACIFARWLKCHLI